jgi:nitroimidazol reductase NimA-like FMN-containing flavoprotein (pyridoxamine 5'-phosphate oxidase superfamily)
MNAKSQMNDEARLALLNSAEVGALSTVNPDGSPYVVPVHFVAQNGKVYIHCGLQGQKLENVKRDGRVCFTAWELNGYKNAENSSPCKTGTYYKSVIINGAAAIVDDPAQKRTILQLFANKYAPDKNGPMPEEAINRTRVIEIVGEITGKQKG